MVQVAADNSSASPINSAANNSAALTDKAAASSLIDATTSIEMGYGYF
jgi:hypothetical protein